MNKAILALISLLIISCATKKVGNNFTVKIDNKFLESTQGRELLDSISDRALQLRKADSRNLDFLGNLTVINRNDTTLIEISEEKIKWKTNATVTCGADIDVEAKPLLYYIVPDRKEVIQFNLYHDGYLKFKPLKYIKLVFRGQSILFKKHLRHYRFVTME
jgi:hypothetical protein